MTEDRKILRHRGGSLGLLAVTALWLTGCATISHGSNSVVDVAASEPQVSVEVRDKKGDLVLSSEVPFSVVLPRGAGYFEGQVYEVAAKKEGVASETVFLHAEIDRDHYLLGNLFGFGFWGWFVVDPLTGAMWRLEVAPPTRAATPSSLGLVLKIRDRKNHDPLLAGLSSFFPGGGYYYLGETGKGLLTMGGIVAGEVVFLGLGYSGQSHTPAFWTAYGATMGLYLFSLVDSVHLALEAERQDVE